MTSATGAAAHSAIRRTVSSHTSLAARSSGLFDGDDDPRPRHSSETLHAQLPPRSVRRTRYTSGDTTVLGGNYDALGRADDNAGSAWDLAALIRLGREQFDLILGITASLLWTVTTFALLNTASGLAIGPLPSALAVGHASAHVLAILAWQLYNHRFLVASRRRRGLAEPLAPAPIKELDEDEEDEDSPAEKRRDKEPLLPTFNVSSSSSSRSRSDLPTATTLEARLTQLVRQAGQVYAVPVCVHGVLKGGALLATVWSLGQGQILWYAFGKIAFTGIQLLTGPLATVALATIALLIHSTASDSLLRPIMWVMASLLMQRLDQVLAVVLPAPSTSRASAGISEQQRTRAIAGIALGTTLAAPWWTGELASLRAPPLLWQLLAQWDVLALNLAAAALMAVTTHSPVVTRVRLPFRCVGQLAHDVAAVLGTMALLSTTGTAAEPSGDETASPWGMLYATMVMQVAMFIRMFLWKPHSVHMASIHPATAGAAWWISGSLAMRQRQWRLRCVVAALAATAAVVFRIALLGATDRAHLGAGKLADPATQHAVLMPMHEPWVSMHRGASWVLPVAETTAPAADEKQQVDADDVILGVMAPSVASVPEGLAIAGLWTSASGDSSTATATTKSPDWHLYTSNQATLNAVKEAGQRARIPGLSHMALAPSPASALKQMLDDRHSGHGPTASGGGPRWLVLGSVHDVWILPTLYKRLSQLAPDREWWLEAAPAPASAADKKGDAPVTILSRNLAARVRFQCKDTTESLGVCLATRLNATRTLLPTGTAPDAVAFRAPDVAPVPLALAFRVATKLGLAAAAARVDSAWARAWTWPVPGHAGWSLEVTHGVRAQLVGPASSRPAIASTAADAAARYRLAAILPNGALEYALDPAPATAVPAGSPPVWPPHRIVVDCSAASGVRGSTVCVAP
ncbi:hypothetical protein H9P43_001693 [Blastocladiella emersonii ATCC 22665]|nr:hypothetical protein H9P43_001693 [Blastocladiella emersonii ATCC 22665]